MKWRKAMTVLATRKKIDSAALFDSEGSLLARTENFAEKQEHIDAVLHVLANSTTSLKLVKLTVFGDTFTCVCPGQAGLLVAKTSEDGRLFVALRTALDCTIIAFSNADATGSCLYEVTEFSKLLQSKVR